MILGIWEKNAFFCFSKFSFLRFLHAFFDFFLYITLVNFLFQSTDHSFWARNLIFGLSYPWDMRKKRIFLFFKIFIFTLFIGIFRFFPYITLVNFRVQATGHSFSPRNVIFGLRQPWTITNLRLLDFFWKFHFLRLNVSFFQFFGNFSI